MVPIFGLSCRLVVGYSAAASYSYELAEVWQGELKRMTSRHLGRRRTTWRLSVDKDLGDCGVNPARWGASVHSFTCIWLKENSQLPTGFVLSVLHSHLSFTRARAHSTATSLTQQRSIFERVRRQLTLTARPPAVA